MTNDDVIRVRSAATRVSSRECILLRRGKMLSGWSRGLRRGGRLKTSSELSLYKYLVYFFLLLPSSCLLVLLLLLAFSFRASACLFIFVFSLFLPVAMFRWMIVAMEPSQLYRHSMKRLQGLLLFERSLRAEPQHSARRAEPPAHHE